MQTSQLARETERVMRALRVPADPAVAIRRSSRPLSQAVAARPGTHGEGANGAKAGTNDASNSIKTERKRKRHTYDESILDSQAVSPEPSTTSTRRSPRKAPKLENDTSIEGKSTSRKAKRQPAKRIKGPSGEITVEPPPGWERVYNVTADMRKKWLAPVDTMGCESLADESRTPKDQRLQTLIALMLSSQTKDTVTAVAMKNLQENLAGGFCLESLLKVEPADLNELISKVGFHNNKTKFIKQTAEILRNSDRFIGTVFTKTLRQFSPKPGSFNNTYELR